MEEQAVVTPINKKAKNLNLLEKYHVIQMISEHKRTVKEVADYYQCGRSQIYEIMKKRAKITERYLMGNENDLTKKKDRDSKYQELNNIMFEWYTLARAYNYPLSGPILQQKAKEIAKLLNIDSFSASNGWLQSFRKRHSIKFGSSYGERIHGDQGGITGKRMEGSSVEMNSIGLTSFVRNISFERNSVDQSSIGKSSIDQAMVERNYVDNSSMERDDIEQSWYNELREMTQGYRPENIAHADEMALFFRVLPNKALELLGESCSSGSHSKERLTVLVIAFADGKMEKLVIVGKKENPRCFRNLDKSKLPVTWRANEKSWMTTAIFEEFLNNLNEKMKKENRNILLFLDDAMSHPIIYLSNIRLVFFPPNLTAKLQPLSNGIMQNLKIHYRKLALKRLKNRREVDKGIDLNSKISNISILDSVFLLNRSLQCVPEPIIRNCFRACGFCVDSAKEFKMEPIESHFEDIQSLVEDLYGTEGKNYSAENYVNVDDRVVTDDVSVKDIAELQNIETVINSDEEDSEEDCDNQQMPSSSQVLQCLDILKNFAKISGQNNVFDKVVELGFYFDDMQKH